MDLPPRPAADPAAWFAAVAAALLNRAELVVAGRPLRTAEVEFYLNHPEHPDPFAHAHTVQREWGRWYFHRAGAAFRGGSFKGLDLALGDGAAAVGVLLRTVVAPDGGVIDGPSRLVDDLLKRTGAGSVAELDTRLPGAAAFGPAMPVHVRATPDRGAEVFVTARVGLSLKRAGAFPEMPRYIGRAYRFLTEPRRIGPGRPQLVAALHRDGLTVPEVRDRTGIAARLIGRYAAAFDEGRRTRDFGRYVGADLGPLDCCRLLGAWEAVYGGPPR
ncbi:MAG TPA: hypothetical protein VH092_20570 [Urbifossiella sp.]|nr:hypothetical protein [Urbifossiella sp.]